MKYDEDNTITNNKSSQFLQGDKVLCPLKVTKKAALLRDPHFEVGRQRPTIPSSCSSWNGLH